VVGAGVGLALSAPDVVQEGVADGTAGHAHRARDDLEIVFFRQDEGLLEGRIRVALLGRDEAGRHLDARGPEVEELLDVGPGEDAAAGDDRYLPARLFLEGADRGDHLGDDLLEGEGGIVDLVALVAQVSAGHGPLDDEAVGETAVLVPPALRDEGRGPRRRDYRHELGRASLRKLGQVHGQSRSRENDVDLLLDGGPHESGEIAQGDHDVDAEHAFRELSRPADLAPERSNVRPEEIGESVGLEETDPRGRDDPHAA